MSYSSFLYAFVQQVEFITTPCSEGAHTMGEPWVLLFPYQTRHFVRGGFQLQGL